MRRHFIVLWGVLLASAVVSCTPALDVRGYVPNPALIAEIAPGEDTKESVLTALGSPSSTATFNTDSWYYISRTTETVAFFPETVIDQSVVAIDFDRFGFVSEIRMYTLDDAQEIVPADGKTPTRGRELGVLQQLLGNVGRFTPPAQ